MTLPTGAWHKAYVLHELVHHTQTPVEGKLVHGPEYAGWLLAAYAFELPERYSDALERAFRRRKVDFVLPRQYSQFALHYEADTGTFT